jgi:hypothetical protein
MKADLDTYSTSEEVESMEGVIKVLEAMLFSMPIPEEIAEKYNYLKQKKYTSAKLKFIPITKAQYPSIGTASKNNGKYQELEDSFINLFNDQTCLFEVVIKSILERGKSLMNPTKNSRYNEGSDGVNDIKAKMLNDLNEYNRKRASIVGNSEKELRMTELFTNTSIQEVATQVTYKTELMQSQLLTLLSSFEDYINKYERTIKDLQRELDLVNTSFRNKEAKFTSEIELLHTQLIRLEAHINAEKIKTTQSNNTLVREEFESEIAEVHEMYKKQIEDLKRHYITDLKSIETSFLQGTNEDMVDYIQKLEQVIRVINERLKSYYDIQRPLQSSWRDEDAGTDVKEVLYAAFVTYCANKYESDAKWLSERLQQCEKDNEKLKERVNYCQGTQLFKEVIILIHDNS